MTSRFPLLDATAAGIVASVLAAPPTLGAGRLVCVDGPSGSGKTTLAAALQVGDLVWFRHAKSGEVAEHVTVAHLLAGPAFVETVPTYRGAGSTW